MKIQVAMFAAAKQLTGLNAIEIEFADDSSPTVCDLRRAIAQAYPQLTPLLSSSAFAIDHEYASDNDRIDESLQVAMIPPVSGG